MRLYWTKERILKDAKRYKYKADWLEGSRTAYFAAKKRGLFSKATRHMLRRPIVRKYNKDKVYALARRCKTAGEFLEKYPGAYSYAIRNEIWEKLKKKFFKVQGSRYLRAIYVFEFIDKTAYVGLSYNPLYRKRDHLKSKSAVGIKSKLVSFKFKILKGFFPPDKAAALEAKTIKLYERKGFVLLNRKVAGGLGAAPVKWTKERILKSTKGFKTRREWSKRYPGAYNAAIRFGLIDKISEELPRFGEKKGTWSKPEEIIRCARKFKTSSEWKKAFPSAYRAAIKKKILPKCTAHMNRINPNFKRWTKESEILNDALKYQTVSDWKRMSSGAYAASKRLGCYQQAIAHMNRIQFERGYWQVKANVFKHAAEFRNVSAFERKYPAAVYSARRNSWILELKSFFQK